MIHKYHTVLLRLPQISSLQCHIVVACTPKKAPRLSPVILKASSGKIGDTERLKSPKGEWSLFDVMRMQGCKSNYGTRVHGLSELDVLSAHSTFDDKGTHKQNQWVKQYLSNSCAYDANGKKMLK